MASKGNNFGTGSMATLILKQAIPLSLSTLAQLLYNIVDRIYIGHIGGESIDPLTGLGLTFPIATAIMAFTLLFGQGGSPVFSIARGAKEKDKANRVIGNSFTMLIIASVIITAVTFAFMKPLLYLLGAGETTYGYAAEYLRIYIWGTFFLMVSSGMNFYITAQGFPITAMITILAGSFLNMALDPIFIFALNLGIQGAAIATVISQVVSFIWVMSFFHSHKAEYKPTRENMKLHAPTCGRIMGVGLTGFVMEFTNSATMIVCNRCLRLYGGDMYVGIMTIVSSVRSIMGVAVNGITSGAQPVLGFNYGAKNWDRVRSGIRYSSLFAFGYTAVAWLVVFLFPAFFIGLFSDDAVACTAAVPYLHIFFMAYVFMSLQFSGQSTFMALGYSKRAIAFSLFRKVVLVIPLTLILPLIMADAVSGVFWAEPISNVVGGAASFFTMYFTVYRPLGKKLTP